MRKSRTELALQELNEEIHIIVKSDSQNDTSYFPDALKVIESFENYLQCSGYQKISNSFTKSQNKPFFVFQQNISSLKLLKHQIFLNFLEKWDFLFSKNFKDLFFNFDPTKEKTHLLPEINITEIILLMYLSLEIQRKQIIGPIDKKDPKNMYILKQIIKILQDFEAVQSDLLLNEGQTKNRLFFSINQEKFVKVMLLKTVKLKLEKQKFDFGSRILPNIQQNGDQKIEFKEKLLTDSFDQNFSLISVQSEYNPSVILEKRQQKMRQSVAMLQSKLNEDDFKLQKKNLSGEEIFHYISLYESKGYGG